MVCVQCHGVCFSVSGGRFIDGVCMFQCQRGRLIDGVCMFQCQRGRFIDGICMFQCQEERFSCETSQWTTHGVSPRQPSLARLILPRSSRPPFAGSIVTILMVVHAPLQTALMLMGNLNCGLEKLREKNSWTVNEMPHDASDHLPLEPFRDVV